MKKKLLILAGDGIGPEVMNEVKKIIVWFNKNKSADFDITEELAGGISFDKHGEPITDKVMKIALESDAVLLGAVGGPKWDKLEFSKKPERALLRLRKDLELFANLRPAICFKELANASTLKPEIVSDLDIMIVRELTGGIYFGSPRGVEKLSNGEKKGINTHTYTTSEIQRVARVAFELARKRNNKVPSNTKAAEGCGSTSECPKSESIGKLPASSAAEKRGNCAGSGKGGRMGVKFSLSFRN